MMLAAACVRATGKGAEKVAAITRAQLFLSTNCLNDVVI